MKKALSLGATILAAGCNGQTLDDRELKVETGGYQITCDNLEEYSPLNRQEYCSQNESSVNIEPFIHEKHIDSYRAAMDCVFANLPANISYSSSPGALFGESDTVYLGGLAEPSRNMHYGGLTVSSRKNGKFLGAYAMVTDRLPSGLNSPHCSVLNSVIHETAHIFMKSDHDSSAYGLDKNDHNPNGENSIMTNYGKCKNSSWSFSQPVAQLITDIAYSEGGTSSERNETFNSLLNSGVRCRQQIDNVLVLDDEDEK